jgi:hypothetical protein
MNFEINAAAAIIVFFTLDACEKIILFRKVFFKLLKNKLCFDI